MHVDIVICMFIQPQCTLLFISVPYIGISLPYCIADLYHILETNPRLTESVLLIIHIIRTLVPRKKTLLMNKYTFC